MSSYNKQVNKIALKHGYLPTTYSIVTEIQITSWRVCAHGISMYHEMNERGKRTSQFL